MAKPPDGASSWHHASDSIMLHADDKLWGMATMPVGRDRLQMTFPFTGQANDFFYAFTVQVESGKVWWCSHPPSGDEARAPWTAESVADELMPEREILPRPKHGPPAGPAIAVVEFGAGEIRLLDSKRRCRAQLWLADEAVDALDGERHALVANSEVKVHIVFPTGDDLDVSTVATSPP